MRTYSLRHLANSTLRHALKHLVLADCGTTALIVAHIAEFIARKLYLEDGYASMYDYCVGELRMSEHIACRRIRAARAARRFPLIFPALADGRLHLTAVSLLAPHLTEENAEELLVGSFHKTKREIKVLIAARFPRRDLPTFIKSLGAAPAAPVIAPSPQVAQGQSPMLAERTVEVATSPVHSSAPARIDVPEVAIPPVHSSAPARIDVPPPGATPLAPGRFAWQLTVGQETQDLLGAVEDLLGHDVPPGDMEAVLKFALRTAKQKLEQRKFAATERPRAGQRHANKDGRHIPDAVRRAVWKRDGGRCTFTSDTGHRCEERKDVQFDHIDPYAKGGEATIGGIRLLCRAHNQYEAERAFGAEFIRHKREAARNRASEAGARRHRPAEAAGPDRSRRAP